MATKDRNKLIRIGEAAAGGLAVSLINMGAEKALAENENGDKIMQFMPGITGALGATMLWMGNDDVQDIGLGVIGASADRATDELADVFQGFKQKKAMNGNVNQGREYQTVMSERRDFDDIENGVDGIRFTDYEIVEEEGADAMS